MAGLDEAKKVHKANIIEKCPWMSPIIIRDFADELKMKDMKIDFLENLVKEQKELLMKANIALADFIQQEDLD